MSVVELESCYKHTSITMFVECPIYRQICQFYTKEVLSTEIHLVKQEKAQNKGTSKYRLRWQQKSCNKIRKYYIEQNFEEKKYWQMSWIESKIFIDIDTAVVMPILI